MLGAEAVLRALEDAGIGAPQTLFVGNMLSGQLSGQENLGALIADHAGLRGIEALKIEAACASAGMALRMAYTAVAGGMCDVAVAAGVEKMTDAGSDDVTAALASAADAVYESEHGVSFVALNALLMRRYMHEYGYRGARILAISPSPLTATPWPIPTPSTAGPSPPRPLPMPA